MTNPATPTTTAYLKSLPWQNQGGFMVATDETCLYMRETAGSRISGFVFGTVFGLGGIAYAGWLFTQDGGGAKAFGGLVLLVGLVFGFIVVSSLRRGPWMMTYDRGTGQPGVSGQIRYLGGSLSAAGLRCITTRQSGGSLAMPRRIVVAELHDGSFEVLGPSGVSTWPAFWAKQAADWMSLPYRD